MWQRALSGSGGGEKSFCKIAVAPSTYASSGYINCGFEPKKILIDDRAYDSNQGTTIAYDADDTSHPNQYYQVYGTSSAQYYSIGTGRQIESIDANGFTLTYYSSFSAKTCLLVVG